GNGAPLAPRSTANFEETHARANQVRQVVRGRIQRGHLHHVDSAPERSESETGAFHGTSVRPLGWICVLVMSLHHPLAGASVLVVGVAVTPPPRIRKWHPANHPPRPYGAFQSMLPQGNPILLALGQGVFI